ncbi:hypothetical protein BU24DRAFT_421819 [Aaosphaeria arxii CBS 175.79]|uniref:Mediator of RNA polymerase II transcription subunit 20 n=1 Tax=Aaosphaeria arxii CBS 175.79 TaxID=1450172 RepID=A0A6A5XQE7_9PLEO|nr:uncharacterized protein BU24DRAFT_421819 [Aaosphaeria arxii CBS 175.79]KAF2015515.1 hypothetical protein BU24DRAFT_421819 [Aaosphaeria arxii CBS 175.79]
MKYSGLYFIPSHANTPDASHTTFTTLLNSIERHFEHAVRQGSWSLTHRMFRSTPEPNNTQPPQHKLQHILYLTPQSTSRTYCFIHAFTPSNFGGAKTEPQSNAPTPQPGGSSQPGGTPRTDPGVVISIPSHNTETHTSFVGNQLQPLWAIRHILNLGNGVTYTVGQFTIHLGELEAVRTSATASSASPGVVVCISTVAAGGEEDASQDDELRDMGYTSVSGADENGVNGASSEFTGAEEAIRGLWAVLREGVDFGRAEVREVMMEKEGLQASKFAESEAAVRMWCDVLRLRV